MFKINVSFQNVCFALIQDRHGFHLVSKLKFRPFMAEYNLHNHVQPIKTIIQSLTSVYLFSLQDRYYLEPPTPILALPPPQPPILSLPPAPPPEPPTLRLNEDMGYGYDNAMYPMDRLPSNGPSFSPDGEVYVTVRSYFALKATDN